MKDGAKSPNLLPRQVDVTELALAEGPPGNGNEDEDEDEDELTRYRSLRGSTGCWVRPWGSRGRMGSPSPLGVGVRRGKARREES